MAEVIRLRTQNCQGGASAGGPAVLNLDAMMFIVNRLPA